MLQARGGGGG